MRINQRPFWNKVYSSIDFVLTCLVTRPLLANSTCAVNLLEESGIHVSHLASRGDFVSEHNCHTTPTFGAVITGLPVWQSQSENV